MLEVIADYTDTDYQKDFWSNSNREYEDMADRMAIKKLLVSGEAVVDIGGGYGRLTPEYIDMFKQVNLFDYAQTLLDQAKSKYQDKIKIHQGSIYNLPFNDGSMDQAIMVRVSHHVEDLDTVMKEIFRVLKNKGRAIIEIANKKNFLEIMRYLFGKSEMRPFDLQPTSRNQKGFYNYHPKYVERIFKQNNFRIKRILSVSNFRNEYIKKIISVRILGLMESLLQKPLGRLRLAPSIYYLLEKK